MTRISKNYRSVKREVMTRFSKADVSGICANASDKSSQSERKSRSYDADFQKTDRSVKREVMTRFSKADVSGICANASDKSSQSERKSRSYDALSLNPIGAEIAKL